VIVRSPDVLDRVQFIYEAENSRDAGGFGETRTAVLTVIERLGPLTIIHKEADYTRW
jgi:hypothetical protein